MTTTREVSLEWRNLGQYLCRVSLTYVLDWTRHARKRFNRTEAYSGRLLIPSSIVPVKTSHYEGIVANLDRLLQMAKNQL